MIGLSNAFECQIGPPGLSVTVLPGVINNAGSVTTVPQTTVALIANTTNYVYVDLNELVVAANLVGFTSNVFPVAIAVTGQSNVISVTDSRCDISASAALADIVSTTPSGTQTIQLQSPSAHSSLVLRGTSTSYLQLELHNNFAVATAFYTHDDAGFRAPVINLYKSRGTEIAPTPVTFTGYELDSVGGINFSGYDGSAYAVGAGIYSQTDQNWSPSGHAAHLSIYDTNINATTQRQVMQFGGVGPNGEANTSIISYRPISFGGAQAATPSLVYTASPATLLVKKADGSGYASFVTGQLTVVAPSVPLTSSSTGTTGAIAWDSNFIYVCVATNTWKRSALSTW